MKKHPLSPFFPTLIHKSPCFYFPFLNSSMHKKKKKKAEIDYVKKEGKKPPKDPQNKNAGPAARREHTHPHCLLRYYLFAA